MVNFHRKKVFCFLSPIRKALADVLRPLCLLRVALAPTTLCLSSQNSTRMRKCPRRCRYPRCTRCSDANGSRPLVPQAGHDIFQKKKKQAGHDRDALLLFVLFLVSWLQIGWEKDERPWRLVGFGLVRWCAAGACGHVLGVVVCVWSALRTNQLTTEKLRERNRS